ncbi:hypothetical protein BST95_12740 [Halioglobus japonicus]|uniref:DUF7281 domain-containing protein n=1 Tax=Halioglobus japonicus TaxID=930805 RepID=A0AAP8MHN8_9GAMM|nr:hypothetical protein [Halioglobus japonicus]AQA18982.1 hypothetical protein BST95_12740 [Halioglobus japonicus]PLW88003.1 hypothetical protein C0029_05445 [Halioglobus japonicus]GHD20426.1 hypothetical protein GCM10007052_29990 [Halioglobus japonicus]
MLTGKQYLLIKNMLDRRDRRTILSSAWLELHNEYGLGKPVGKHMIQWTRDDHKKWREIIAPREMAREAADLGADRTSVAKYTPDEKISKVSVREGRVFCQAIHTNLFLKQGPIEVYPEVEYVVSQDDIDLQKYGAILIVENLEAYIYCHSFVFADLNYLTLVVYRGHDASARAVNALLERTPERMKVIIFPDADPAGVSIAMSTETASHVIVPDLFCLSAEDSVGERFSKQLAKFPDLRDRAKSHSIDFQEYVDHLLNRGYAVSQERLCSRHIRLNTLVLRMGSTSTQCTSSTFERLKKSIDFGM